MSTVKILSPRTGETVGTSILFQGTYVARMRMKRKTTVTVGVSVLNANGQQVAYDSRAVGSDGTWEVPITGLAEGLHSAIATAGGDSDNVTLLNVMQSPPIEIDEVTSEAGNRAKTKDMKAKGKCAGNVSVILTSVKNEDGSGAPGGGQFVQTENRKWKASFSLATENLYVLVISTPFNGDFHQTSRMHHHK